jgi:3-methyl-2-oxobutanoate hydroxymethyltransferase
VTVDELIPLARAVATSVKRALVLGDAPFGSYEASQEQAYLTAVRFMKEAQVAGVKLEGGREMVPRIERLTGGEIPVCAHIGFTRSTRTPHGGYRVQGRGDAAQRVLADAPATWQRAGSNFATSRRSPTGAAPSRT